MFDTSCGRGLEISNIETPYENVYTGYAGGISVDNIENVCENITSHKDNSFVWIDMESGVRTNDEFDIDKVNKVIEKVIKYM